MPNLMLDFTKGFVSNIAPDSVTSLVSSSKEIFDTVIGGAKTASGKYREIRNNGGFKKLVDSFFHRGDEFGSSSTLGDDDEFDPGTNFGIEDDDSNTSKVLDTESMKGIMRGQVSAMYEIGGKQAEASAMTTSEIITTVNTRSSEILSSLTKINTNLTGINERLDKLIELSSPKKSDPYIRNSSIFDSSGNLTLGHAFDFLKNATSDKLALPMSMISTVTSLVGGMSAMGTSKGEMAGMAAGMLIPMILEMGSNGSKLGSANNWYNRTKNTIDETIANVQNDLLTKLFNVEKFKDIFGDLTKRTANQNYGSYVENQYNREKATFDGITRTTIINVIPGYLKKITQALTGKEYNVSDEGYLTTDKPGNFKSVFGAAIQTGMSAGTIHRLTNTNQTNIDEADLYIAQRVLIAVYVGESLNEGININSSSLFENGGLPHANQRAIELLTGAKNKGRTYWKNAVEWIITSLQIDSRARGNFTRALNKAIQGTDATARNYAKSANYTADIGSLDTNLQNDVIREYLGTFDEDTDERTLDEQVQAGKIKNKDVAKNVDRTLRASAKKAQEARLERRKQSELLGGLGASVQEMSTQTLDYVASIFYILNRGINVYSVQRDKPFGKYPLQHARGRRSTKAISTSQVYNNTPGGTDTNTPPTPQPSSSGGTDDSQSTGFQPTGSFIGDLWEIASNPFRTAVNNVKDDIAYGKDRLLSGFANVYDRHMINRSLKGLGNSVDDESDRTTVEAVLAAMQTAAMDGDGKEDLGALSSQIAKIRNPELRARVQGLVENTLSRVGSVQPAKSRIGKILMWGLGLVKKYVSPLLSKAKTFIIDYAKKLGDSFVGKLGKTIFNKILDSFKSSGMKILTGAQSVKEGVTGLAGNIVDVSKGLGEFASNIGSAAMDQIQIKRIRRGETRTIGEQAKENATLLAGLTYAGIGLDKAKDAVGTVKEKASAAAEKIGDKFRESEFGKGFMSAFDKKTLTPKTAADKATTGILDLLKSKDGGGGVLSTIVDSIKLIGEIFRDSTKEITDDMNKTEQSSTGQGTTTQSAVENRSTEEGGGFVAPPEPSGDESTGSGDGDVDVKMPSLKAPDTGGTDAAGGGDKKGGLFNIGKTLGGISKILMGIGQAVLTVIMSLSGFKALTKLITGILQKSLKPLNKAFQAIIKVLKPVVTTITKVLRQIVGYVVQIVESVIKIIQPILEAIGPIIEQLLSVLEPILELITGLVKLIMIPLVSVMKEVVVPILQTVANTLEIILGIVQVGMGLILTVLGGILTAVGVIGKIFGAPSLYETGKNMISMGTSMVSSGWGSMKSGFGKTVTMLGNAITGKSSVEQEDKQEQQVQASKTIPQLNGSPMDGIVASGDIYAGDGAQARYGAYMNMAQRGCGPVALTDAYARRTGNTLDARRLAVSMSNAGAYDASNGTSVRGYMNTSRALGMNLTPGGVTQRSLSMASPSNPITVVGSGPDFSTRRGNNHYMNVLGTSNGMAIVSNPLTGRIERKSASSLASSSLMGLYGSGDSPIEFSDTIQDALGNLKDIVGQLVSIFIGESDMESSLNEEQKNAKNQKALQDAGIDLSNMDENDRIKLEQEAREIFKKENSKYAGESDAEYEKRFQKNINTYYAKAATERLKKQANTDSESFSSFMKTAIGETDENGNPTGGIISGMTDALSAADSSAGSFIDQMTTALTGNNVEVSGTGFFSDRGAKLATDVYTPSIFEPNIPQTGATSESPLHEFFTMTNGSGRSNKAWSSGNIGHWFRKRQTPNRQGQGTTGSDHSGIDFLWSSDRTPEVVATTGGTVRTASSSWDKSTGNTLIWKDSGGDEHHYYHLSELPYTYVAGMKTSLNPGDKIQGGQVVGRVGSTGHSTGAHLHYTIKDGASQTKLNPMTFFKWREDESDSENGPSSIVIPTDSYSYTLGVPVTFNGNGGGMYSLTDENNESIASAMNAVQYDKLKKQSIAYSEFRKTYPDVYEYTYGKDKYYVYNVGNSENAKTVLKYLKKSDGERYLDEAKAQGYMDPNRNVEVSAGESSIEHGLVNPDVNTKFESTMTTTVANGDMSSIIQQDIPPLNNIDELFQYSSDMQSQQPVIVNRYRQSATTDMTENVKRIMDHTFNVRSVQIETMLSDMLKLMKERNQQRKQQQLSTKPPRRKLDGEFQDNDIPKQVERLSVG